MKRKVKELKRIARSNLTGQYLPLMKPYLWINMLVLLVEMPFSMMKTEEPLSSQNIIYYLAIALINVIAIILVCGKYRMHLSMARTGQTDFNDFWEPVKNQPDRYIIANAILFGLTLVALAPMGIGLWLHYQDASITNTVVALGLSVISIIFYTYISLSLNLTFFMMVDDHNLTSVEALKRTQQIIRGYKKRYLYLELSFLGYHFLNLFTFGFGMFWIDPYMTQTLTLFYLDIKGELDAVLEERNKTESPEPTVVDAYV